MDSFPNFGAGDNLNLQLSDLPEYSPVVEEVSVDDSGEKDIIRGLKDENGRLNQLVKEKQFEIKQLRKEINFQNNGMKLTEITNETAAFKIVELSKKLRQAVADLEVEKTKSRCLAKNYEELKQDQMNCTKSPPSPNCLEEEIKQLQGKLKQTENKMNEWRNQSQTMKQELKLANKVICQEVGEGSNIHSLLAENSTWKGRAQQIIALQQKVCDLKQNLKQLQAKVSNNGEIPAPVENSNSQALKQIVNKRKDIQEKLDQELKNSQEKYASLKTKFDGIKARCQILSNEVKLNKQQIQVLLEKGKRDEDLIETLMNQLSRLKEMIASKPSVPRHEPIELHSNSLSNIVEKQNTENLVKQLKVIIEEKDKRLVLLENQVGQAQYKKCPQCNNYCESSIYDEDSEATNLSDDSLNQAILPITVDASS